MKPPIFVKRLSKKQRAKLEKGLRSQDGFEMRRSQIILASARGEQASTIANNLGCSEGTAGNAIKAFNDEGLACLKEKSSRPKTLHIIMDEDKRVKREGGVRIIKCFLPVKSPWLNPIEPRWLHGKRAIVEPTRTLTAQELIERVCIYYRVEHLDHLKQKVA
jgi:hypothetical protein